MFLCGDVMSGRGIDQVLPHPSHPTIYEPYVRDARRYVDLAERENGAIQQPVDFSYIWGDALALLKQVNPDVRIINLETSITTSPEYWEGKGINYRMHPDNVPCITAAEIDICSLANNHVLDWGYAGLRETLDTLRNAKLRTAGAGENLREAETPAVVEVDGKGRVILFSFGSGTSGIPPNWAAAPSKPGVNLLRDLSDRTVRRIRESVHALKRPGDVFVASIHWGSNWGYEIPRGQARFAHDLIDHASVDVVYGHSSHHPKGIEVYREKPILYGCGDFINDYEGIGGYEEFRGDLGLMYFVRMNPATGELVDLNMIPTQMKNFRVRRATAEDARWIRDTLNREGKKLGTRVELGEDDTLTLRWE